MKTEFKEIFEKAYGAGSLNDDFLITAESAKHLAETYAELRIKEELEKEISK